MRCDLRPSSDPEPQCLLTGQRLTAAEAEIWGLVNRVVPGRELAHAALCLADSVCAAAPLAVRAVLEIVRETECADVAKGFEIMRSGRLTAYQAMLDSADASEGPCAFADRRTPVWQGR